MFDIKKKLRKVVDNGDLEQIDELLKHFDLSDQSQNLYKKSKRRKLETLPDQYKFDLLTKAIQRKNAKVFQFLLSKGFKVSYDDLKSAPSSLLNLAIKHSTVEIVGEILRHDDVDVNIGDGLEFSPLIEAIKRKDLDILKVILNSGADVNRRCKNTPLQEAIKKGSLEMVTLLLEKGADVNDKSYHCKNTPLQEAIRSGKTAIFELLLNRGADISVTTPGGVNLVLYTSKWGNADMMKHLLNRGMEVNSLDNAGRSALFHAIEAKNEDIAVLLLDHGAISNSASQRIWHDCFLAKTALHYACEGGLLKVVCALLKEGADSRKVDSVFNTPVYYAAFNGRDKVVELLLDQGNLDVSEDYMIEALEIAARSNHAKVVELFLARGVVIQASEILHDCSELGFEEIVKILLDHGAEVNSFNHNGLTPLQCAAKNVKVEVVTLLLDHGANVHILDSDLAPILHFPAYDDTSISASQQLIRIFLDRGVNIDATDRLGRTALIMAYRVEIALFLIELGADFNIADRDGATVIDNFFDLERQDEMILKSIVKRKYTHAVTMGDNILQFVQNRARLNTLLEKCEEEIKKMKEERFEGSDVTVYDIFETNNFHQLTAFARNENIVNYFGSGKHYKIFPTYAEMIEDNFEMGLSRQKLLGHAKIFFDLLHCGNGDKKLSVLPVTCTDKILNYLENDDLIKLKKVCRYKRKALN